MHDVEYRRSGSTRRAARLSEDQRYSATWYTLWPVHDYVFGGMLQRIAAASAAA